MQPVNTGGPIVGRHDLSKYSFCLANGTGPRIRYLNILEPEVVTFLVDTVLRYKPCTLLVSTR